MILVSLYPLQSQLLQHKSPIILEYRLIEFRHPLHYHLKILQKILNRSYPNVSVFFQEINVNLEICMVEWVFSLFSSLIPIDIQYNFYYG
jgi:hypothetical protein